MHLVFKDFFIIEDGDSGKDLTIVDVLPEFVFIVGCDFDLWRKLSDNIDVMELYRSEFDVNRSLFTDFGSSPKCRRVFGLNVFGFVVFALIGARDDLISVCMWAF